MSRLYTLPVERIVRAAILLSALGFLFTVHRVPTLWYDSQLYAAIARSRQLHGFGVPSVNLPSPAGIDHVLFYGPVFFDSAAAAFTWFGVSLMSFRLIGLCGTGILAWSAARLTYDLTRVRDRATLSAALVLLTPEIQAAATSGDLETTAVGFEMAALAVYVRGLQRQSHPVWHGALAGVCLALAALTTPRTYPFVAAFLLCGLIPIASRRARRGPALQLGAVCMVVPAGLALWAVNAHGSIGLWLSYMGAILAGDNWNILALPGSAHRWGFNWSSLVTPIAAFVTLIIAAGRIANSVTTRVHEHGAALFALMTTALSAVAIVAGMNLTFSVGIYFAIPLFVAGMALPRSFFALSDQALRRLVILVFVSFAALAGLRYARIAVTWSARDPGPVDAFIRQHVPANAHVIGPDAIYFFSVEKMGAHYRSVEPVNADWTLVVPEQYRTAADTAMLTVDVEPRRYLIWPAKGPLPEGYECARRRIVARFEPAPTYLHYLGPLGRVWDIGYPPTAIYALSESCPAN